MSAVETEIQLTAPLQQIWAAVTDAADWLPFGVVAWDARPGGLIEVRFPGGAAVTGRVTEVLPAQRLSFTWSRPGWPRETEVVITLEPGPRSTRLALTHHHLRPDLRELYQRTWAVSLERLASVVSSL